MMSPSVRAFLLALLVCSVPGLAQHAADDYYDPAAMKAARERLREDNGGQTITFFQADRLENVRSDDANGLLWDAQGWIGTDYSRLWIKTEGERLSSPKGLVDAEVQALYSRPISPFFDLQAGVRQDLVPGERRTFGVVGFQGLAPYLFELDTALFISHEGDVSARVEAEYELRLTQRLILQPRAEVNFALQDVPRLGIGRGLSTAEAGGRLRYEIKRQFAPYIGVNWVGNVGRTADFVRAEGNDPSSFVVIGGLRLWF